MNIEILALSDMYAFSGILCLVSIPLFIIASLIMNKGPIKGSLLCATICIIWALCMSSSHNTELSYEYGPDGEILGVSKNADGDDIVGISNNAAVWIANDSKTKFIEKPADSMLDRNICLVIKANDKYTTPQVLYYISKDEYKELGTKRYNEGYTKGHNLVRFLSGNGGVMGDEYFRFYSNNSLQGAIENPAYMAHRKTNFFLDDFYNLDSEKVYSKSAIPTKDGGLGIPQWLWHPACGIWIFGLFGFIPLAITILVGLR